MNLYTAVAAIAHHSEMNAGSITPHLTLDVGLCDFQYHYIAKSHSLESTTAVPSVPIDTMLCAESPQPTPAAEIGALNGSDHNFVDFVYCFTVMPAEPPTSKY